MRASISTHIAREYYFLNGDRGYWGENIPLFIERVGNHPDRLNDMYFAFLFLVRAVSKLRMIESSLVINTGDYLTDSYTENLLHSLLEGTSNNHSTCGSIVDVEDGNVWELVSHVFTNCILNCRNQISFVNVSEDSMNPSCFR